MSWLYDMYTESIFWYKLLVVVQSLIQTLIMGILDYLNSRTLESTGFKC